MLNCISIKLLMVLCLLTVHHCVTRSGPASWWVICCELLQVSEWWVARSGNFQILPARYGIFQILPAGVWIFQILTPRSWIFQILPTRFGIFLILAARTMNISNFASKILIFPNLLLEYSKFCMQDFEFSKSCWQDFEFSKSCQARVNLVIFKIFIAMSNCVRAELRAASSSTNFVYLYQKT